MKIGVLTSSRADYGIYRPLLDYWRNNPTIGFSFEIIAFGQHLFEGFGKTFLEIEDEGYDVKYKINSDYVDDTPHGIAISYSNVINKFVDFWNENKFDLVLVLGDRYEMAAAVQAGVPYNIKFAHIHAGEKTLGAIDEIFRHQISLASELHFVSIQEYEKRIHDLIGHQNSTTITGAIGLENLKKVKLLTPVEFKEKWHIDITLPTLFIIVHPETVNVELNIEYAKILEQISMELSKEYQLIISLPNSDTKGNVFRTMWKNVSELCNEIKLIEHFGTQSFFTCMEFSKLIIGNSSSAILEAASFQKFALNLGSRQEGRITSDNIINLPFDKQEVLANVKNFAGKIFDGKNIYEKKNGIQLIDKKIKNYLGING